MNGKTISNVVVDETPIKILELTVTPDTNYVGCNVNIIVRTERSSSSFRYKTTIWVDNNQPIIEDAYQYGSITHNPNFTSSKTTHTISVKVEDASGTDFSLTKTYTLNLTECQHKSVSQFDGKCYTCQKQMAASVSPSALVDQRTYYETFDAALSAAWEQLKIGDCWLVLFQDAIISAPIANEYISSGYVLNVDLNGRKITCANDSVFRVPESSKWTLNLRVSTSGGSLIGGSSSHGTIDVAAGGYAYIDVRGNYTITNTANAECAIEVHTQNSSDPSQAKIGRAEIDGNDSTKLLWAARLRSMVAISLQQAQQVKMQN